MTAVLAKIPLTLPNKGSTEATPVLPLLHVPPLVTSAKVIVEPTHTAENPDIAPGNALTVIVVETEQPDATE